MRRLTSIAAAVAFTAGGGEVGGSAQAGPMPNAVVGAAASAALPLEEVQFF